MPRLWTDTIEEHRRSVRDAILHTTAALVTEHGLRSVTMSQIAEATGIGRATLYKYFSGVEPILHAWHERQIAAHLEQLAAARDAVAGPADRLAAVMETYALISHENHGHSDTELAAFLHGDERVSEAESHLRHMIHELLVAAARDGHVRNDVAADELTAYCLHALAAANTLPSKAAVRRLVQLTLAGLRAPG